MVALATPMTLAAEDLGRGSVEFSDLENIVNPGESLETFMLSEVVEEVKRRLALRRTYQPPVTWRVRAMTVEQAKNLEFDSVIVLWPVEIESGIESSST